MVSLVVPLVKSQVRVLLKEKVIQDITNTDQLQSIPISENHMTSNMLKGQIKRKIP